MARNFLYIRHVLGVKWHADHILFKEAFTRGGKPLERGYASSNIKEKVKNRDEYLVQKPFKDVFKRICLIFYLEIQIRHKSKLV